MKSISLKPDINELDNLKEFILNELGEKSFQANFIAEEIFINIVNYSKTEFIKVNLEYTDFTLILEFIDNGIKFNPLLKDDYSAPESIDEAQIGGLGIHLTRQIADDMSYQHVNGENHLKIIKKVEH